VQRGDVYELRRPGRFSPEPQGRRFGVVVQPDALLPRSGETTKVLVEQVGAVDVNRLGGHVGLTSPEEMWGIDDSLVTVLGLH